MKKRMTSPLGGDESRTERGGGNPSQKKRKLNFLVVFIFVCASFAALTLVLNFNIRLNKPSILIKEAPTQTMIAESGEASVIVQKKARNDDNERKPQQPHASQKKEEEEEFILPPIDYKECLMRSLNNRAELKSSKIVKYIKEHDKLTLPVVVVCHNRADQLALTLDRLMKLRGMDSGSILVSQDGNDESTANEARSRQLKLIQNIRVGHNPNAGSLIATHFAYTINEAFDYFQNAPAIIILEDDLRPSPDFLEYFLLIGALSETDDSIWCVSAWNDNGFQDGLKATAKSKFELKRTSLFPGLGWLLYRNVWETNLKSIWANDQWDWFLRGELLKKNKECVYPEISRTFHGGRVGTFITSDLQKNYFDKIVVNEDANLHWCQNEHFGIESISKDLYNKRIEAILMDGKTLHVDNAATFEDQCEKIFSEEGEGRFLVVWYNADINPAMENSVRPLTNYFSIWHQLLRSSHEGLHEVRFRGKCKVLLINVFTPRPIASSWFTPPSERSIFFPFSEGKKIFSPQEFAAGVKMGEITKQLQRGEEDGALPKKAALAIRLSNGAQVVEAKVAESCLIACVRQRKKCDLSSFPLLNECDIMKQVFECATCDKTAGEDLPAFVDGRAPTEYRPKTCLLNEAAFRCEGSHAVTRRLCPCV